MFLGVVVDPKELADRLASVKRRHSSEDMATDIPPTDEDDEDEELDTPEKKEQKKKFEGSFVHD